MTTTIETCGRRIRLAALAALSTLLAACASAPRSGGDGVRAPPPAPAPIARSAPAPAADAPGRPRRGAYYLDDGPGDAPPPNLDQLADAVPRVEPYHRFANRPYVVFGREYQPDLSERPYRQRGMGSWYGRKFHGQRTSSGEIYDMYAMTAAHPTLPLPSYARVVNTVNGRSVIVRVNDRGPFLHDRVIDLSYAAAHKLGYALQGSALLEVERLMPDDIRAGRIAPTTTMLAMAGPAAVAPAVGAAAAPASGATPVTAVRAAPAAEPARAGASALDDGAIVNVVASSDLIVATVLPASPVAPAASATAPATTGTGPVTAGTAAPTGAPVAAGAPRASAAATATAATTTPAALTGGFMLQLGAFRNQAGAEEFRTRLTTRIAALGERLRVVPGSDFFRVQLGPFGDRRDAEAAARELRGVFDFNPLVVPRR